MKLYTFAKQENPTILLFRGNRLLSATEVTMYNLAAIG